jgi:hypothetical protein
MRRSPTRIASLATKSAQILNRFGKLSMLQKDVSHSPHHAGQQQLLSTIAGAVCPSIIYLEFGVWRGESMKIAVEAFSDKDALFYGFDSFEGLPEDWDRFFGKTSAAGTFDVGGKAPDMHHNRVTFVKGWFEETLGDFLANTPAASDPVRDMVVYLDADLYGPTHFVLHRLAAYRDKLFVICDDWTGGTGEAVADFAHMSRYEIRYLGQLTSDVHGLPMKVALTLERRVQQAA